MTPSPSVAIINRVMPHYRLPVMEDLAARLDGKVNLVYSRGIISGAKKIDSCISGKVKTFLLEFRQIPIPLLARRYTIGYHNDLPRTLAEIGPDVVITEGESNLLNSIVAAQFCRQHGVPLIWWGCGRVRNKPVSAIRTLIRPFLRRLLRSTSAVIGYSSYACAYYRDTYGLPAEKMFVAPNSLHPSTVPVSDPNEVRQLRTKLGIPADAPTILYVGALTSVKNPDLFFEIFSCLKRTIPDLHGILVGDGPMLAGLRSLANCDDHFHITGPVIKGVHNYFHAADMFVMPGLGGLALQQAMMCGKPVICSVADGTELDLVKDGRNGHFIEPGQPTALWAEKIGAILKNTELRRGMGAESKRIIDAEFNSNIMVQRIMDAIGYAARCPVAD